VAKQLLVYADACVFLNVIKREEGLWPESLKVLLAAERGDIRLAASTLLLAELGGWKGDVDSAKRDAMVDQYLEALDTVWTELDFVTVRTARDLAGRYHLRGADAVHLATAVRCGADYFLSRDRGYPIGTEIDGTKLREPSVVWSPTVDDELVEQQIAEQLEAGQADPHNERVTETVRPAPTKRLVKRRLPKASAD
jgi:predicted nucleic acid-binding protein